MPWILLLIAIALGLWWIFHPVVWYMIAAIGLVMLGGILHRKARR